MNNFIQKLTFLSFILIATFLFSCGGDKNSKAGHDIKPQSTTIDGYLSDYLEIVDGTYKAEKDDEIIFSWIVKVKIKAKTPYKEDDYGFKDGNHGPLYLDLYDDKGVPLTGLDNLESNYTCDSKLADILKAGSGETWVIFKKYHGGSDELPNNVATFLITSKKISKPESSASDDSQSGSQFLGRWVAVENNNNVMSINKSGDHFIIKANGMNDKGEIEGGNLVTTEDGKRIEFTFDETTGNLTLSAEGHTIEFKKQ